MNLVHVSRALIRLNGIKKQQMHISFLFSSTRFQVALYVVMANVLDCEINYIPVKNHSNKLLAINKLPPRFVSGDTVAVI